MTTPATGHLLDSFPYVRVGSGEKKLVVIPGFGDSMFGGWYPAPTAWALQSYFHRFTDEYTIYLISRPRSLPENYSIDDATEQYGQILDSIPTPADILGISMGGFIGQELAARYPELVEQLVITASGHRVADPGRPTVRRWKAYADRHRWFQIRSELATELYSYRDWRRYTLPPTIQMAGRFVLPRPAVPTDVSRSLTAILEYDGSNTLDNIEADTLVVGGSNDLFFPASILRETADRIPDASVDLIDGAKHGVFDERKRRYDTAVKSFLRGPQQISAD
jgi:pimeloyl-ACP methyl ester carboxylesterase